VAPMSAAFQQMIDRCRTPFYVQVDEDMILFPEAIERLQIMLEQSAPDTAIICAPLWDCDVQRPIQGLKIYRHEIVKQFPYRDLMICEIDQLRRIEAAGYKVVQLPVDGPHCLGEHGKHYTPESIFKRWQRSFQKHLQKGRMPWVAPYPQWLLDRYVETRDPRHLYALLGAIAGIAGAPAADKEQDWRVPNEALERIQRFFPVSHASVNGDCEIETEST